MDTGIIETTELLQQISDLDGIRFRMALVREGADWRAHTLLMEQGLDDQERAIESFVFDYGAVYLAAGSIDGRKAKQWLDQREGEVVPPGRTGPVRRFSLPPSFASQVSWYRYPSHSVVDLRSVPCPVTTYDLSGQYWQNMPAHQGFLVSDGCPFFPDMQSALYQLIYQADDEVRVTGLGPSPHIDLRVGHSEGRLEDIRLSPTAVSVRVAGTRVAGTQLTISGAGGIFHQKQLIARQTVTCVLRDGIPSQLYIVLSRGHKWVDYYARDTRWGGFRTKPPSNVTVEFGDKTTEYEALISEGEGPNTEFKGRLSGDGDRFLRTISAFANGVGGTIFLGIENETAATLGIDTSPTRQMDTISRLIRDNLTPNPEYSMDTFKRDGKNIIVVRILPGESDIYGLRPAEPHYYIRRGASNFPAKPEELRQIILARQSVLSKPPFY